MEMPITYWSGETSIVVYLVTCYLSLSSIHLSGMHSLRWYAEKPCFHENFSIRRIASRSRRNHISLKCPQSCVFTHIAFPRWMSLSHNYSEVKDGSLSEVHN